MSGRIQATIDTELWCIFRIVLVHSTADSPRRPRRVDIEIPNSQVDRLHLAGWESKIPVDVSGVTFGHGDRLLLEPGSLDDSGVDSNAVQ